MKMVVEETITEDEAALYDRQIRLWGLDAQRRLRAARVLLVGVRGLGAEVAKNIVLSGIKSLTLLDHTEATEEDTCSNFLIAREDIGKNRAESARHRTQLLNPMVEVRADVENVEAKSDEFFKEFDVVCALCCNLPQLYRINQICADNKIKFFSGDVFGYYGYMFADLGFHEFAEEVQKKVPKQAEDGEPTQKKAKTEAMETVIVKKAIQYHRLKAAMEVDWQDPENVKKIRRTPKTYFILKVLLQFMEDENRRPEVKTAKEDIQRLLELRNSLMEKLALKTDHVDDGFSKRCFAELSPVCAIVGGVLGQEIIKAVSQKDHPHNNFFFYSGVDGGGLVDKIGS